MVTTVRFYSVVFCHSVLPILLILFCSVILFHNSVLSSLRFLHCLLQTVLSSPYMGKKRQTAKNAQPTRGTSLQDFKTIVIAAVDGKSMQGKENLAYEVLCVQESPTTSQLTTTAPVSTCNFCLFLKKADYKNVSHFCDWASTTSNGANLKLLWTCVIDEGKKLGIEEGRILWYKEFYGEGYVMGCSDTLQDELAFEEFRSEGFREGLSIRFKNGELARREAERAT
jgi:hypothetical protein